MKFKYFVLLLLPFALSHCGAIAEAVNDLLADCEDFANNESDSDLNQACRELEDFLESSQDNLATKTEILNVRTSGSASDASLLLTDTTGNPITGLGTADIIAAVSSDGGSNFTDIAIENVQTYEELATSEAGETHLSFASIVDYSGSIFDDDLEFVTDALTFVYENLPSNYRSEVVKFSTDVQITQAYTEDAEVLLSAVQDTSFSRSATSLFDGLKQGLEDTAAETTSLRLAILFTDGLDNDSTASYNDVKTIFQDNDIPVCVVGVGFANLDLLQDIANDSGCFFIYKTLFSELEGAFEEIVDQIKNVYRVRVDEADLTGMDTLRLTITTADGARTATSSL